MDRLTFRAWSQKHLKMLSPAMYTVELWNGEIAVKVKDIKSFDSAHYERGPQPILMQFTGRTDSKDKEIFEGDILLARGEKGTVKWETDRFIVYSNALGMDVAFPLHSYSPNEIVIIGNIYQGEEPPTVYGQQPNETA